MELYLQEYSPRSSTIGSYMDIYDFVRSRRSLADGRSSCVRFFVGFAILASTALRIYSLLVFFSRVEVQVFLLSPDSVAIDGEHRKQIFRDFITDFSFPEMVQDFWNARAYLVSIIIVTGSAAIPLMKHVFMLIAWIAPVSHEWLHTRRHLLFMFDQTGRTALVDLFLLGYVICIFYTKVIQSVGGYGLEILLSAEPVRGLFCGVGSTFTSSFLSHYLLLVHDEQNMGDFESQVTVAAGPAVASLRQRLRESYLSKTYKRAATFGIPVLILACGVLLGVLFGASYGIVLFRLEGLAGTVADAQWREFNLLTAPLNMPKNSEEVFGTKLLAVLHIVLVFAVPMGLLISATVLWFVPIHLRPQRRFLALFPFWHSWCALDVFFITTFASYLEMHLIAEFIFDKNFHTLCSTLKAFGVTCVELGHESGVGLYLLALCTLLFSMLAFSLGKLGNDLLETASNTIDPTMTAQLSPFMDNNVVSISPILTRMNTNEYVVLGGSNGDSNGGTPVMIANSSVKKVQPSSFW